MTTSTVQQHAAPISDSEAKRIADECTNLPLSPMDVLARTGEIMGGFAGTAKDCVASRDYGDRFAVPYALWAYVAHHGVRGPVDGWEAI